MPSTSSFIYGLASVFSHSHPAIPTLLPVSDSQRPTSSHSSASSATSSSSTRSTKSKKSKKFAKNMKLHNDVWWTMTPQTSSAGRYEERPPIILHEWSYMCL